MNADKVFLIIRLKIRLSACNNVTKSRLSKINIDVKINGEINCLSKEYMFLLKTGQIEYDECPYEINSKSNCNRPCYGFYRFKEDNCQKHTCNSQTCRQYSDIEKMFRGICRLKN